MNLRYIFAHYRYFIIWILAILILISTVYWGNFFNRTKVIRIATAGKGGYYYYFGNALKRQLELETEFQVELLTTAGSVENRSLLLADKADFSIIQGGATSLKNLHLIRPLWHDYIQIIIRKDINVNNLKELTGSQVALGSLGSGYRSNALKLLNYFSLSAKDFIQNDTYFKKITSDPKIQAAIVTTNILNPDIQEVMRTGLFDLLPLNANQGFSLYYPSFHAAAIQPGSYITPNGPMPLQAVPTARTSANFVARQDIPHYMVVAVVEALQSESLKNAVPVLINPDELKKILENTAMHPLMERRLQPNSSFSELARILDFLFHYSWLIAMVGLGAISTFYIWRINRSKLIAKQDDQLNKKLELGIIEIINISNQQQAASNQEILKKYALEVYEVKQQILEETLGTSAAKSPLMHIFLQESNGLLRQIEWKTTLGQ